MDIITDKYLSANSYPSICENEILKIRSLADFLLCVLQITGEQKKNLIKKKSVFLIRTATLLYKMPADFDCVK